MNTFVLALVPAAAVLAYAEQPRIANAELETRAVSGVNDLRMLVSSQRAPAWIGYTVPVIPGERHSCCYHNSGQMSWSGCALEPGDHSRMVNPPGPIRLEASRELVIMIRAENGQLDKVRHFSGDCDLDAGGLSVFWLTGLAPADSVAYLHTLVNAGSERDSERNAKSAAGAIALHSDPAANAYLEKYVAVDQPEWLRRHLAFWLGAARGRPGFELMRRMIKDERQGDRVREAVTHGLAQSKESESTKLLVEVARSDNSAKVRSQALFWLAQKGAREAVPAIHQAIENDPETKVKEQAVFALTQLPREEGIPLLINTARNNQNPAVRKKAMFWLGQSKDPRAVKFFEELLVR
jgi:hypothetical protein